MKRVLAALAVAGAQPLLAYSDPAPKTPTCPAQPTVGHAQAEPEPSIVSDKGTQNTAARSMLAHGLVNAAAAPPAGKASETPAAQAPASSSKESNFHGMSKSIIQNIRARTSAPALQPVGPVPGANSADGQGAGTARLGAKPQDAVAVPISSGRDGAPVSCTGPG